MLNLMGCCFSKKHPNNEEVNFKNIFHINKESIQDESHKYTRANENYFKEEVVINISKLEKAHPSTSRKAYFTVKEEEEEVHTEEINLIEFDVEKYPKLELIEQDGYILEGKNIMINAEGMISDSLRNAKDGFTYFGFSKFRDDQIANDVMLSYKNIGDTTSTEFQIYFDFESNGYYLAPGANKINSELLLFIKLLKKYKITKKTIISVGNVHFAAEVDTKYFTVKLFRTFELRLELAYENDKSISKAYSNNIVVKIGRSKENEIYLDNFAYSRIHTTFTFDFRENSWYIQDGSGKPSTNGTWVFLDSPWLINENIDFRIGDNILGVKLVPI